MTILEAYKREEALDLKERGLLIALTIPLGLNDPVLTTWKNHLKSRGAPYLIVQNGSGCTIHKERRDFRCKHCGEFLNVRPEKWRAHFTHKRLGLPCANRS